MITAMQVTSRQSHTTSHRDQESHPLQENLLTRIAEALERLAPPPPPPPDLGTADAFIWQAHPGLLQPVDDIHSVPIDLLKGINDQKELLLTNTRVFALGHTANNVLLWGARGTGKSSLIKSVFQAVNAQRAKKKHLALIEIQREDIATLPDLLQCLRAITRRCILFCDDLSFNAADTHYKSLKSVLDGGIAGRPSHILFYATSNLRHLTPREDDGSNSPLAPVDHTDEQISLSDRFGLWIGFHSLDQDTYLEIVAGYASAYGLAVQPEKIRAECLEWARLRGALSGRVAWQYIQFLAGRLKKPLLIS